MLYIFHDPKGSTSGSSCIEPEMNPPADSFPVRYTRNRKLNLWDHGKTLICTVLAKNDREVLEKKSGKVTEKIDLKALAKANQKYGRNSCFTFSMIPKVQLPVPRASNRK